jgi:cardiolipin synthase
VQLLRDAAENYPAWLSAIESARHWVHFETFILRDDMIGRQFADLLAAKARAGVRVRLIYDWVGSLGYASRRFWRHLNDAGVDVRRFNSPSLENPFGWINRDHRKMIGVDGRIAFVTGLCVGQQWLGNPRRHIDPWRDTGIAIEGPAVAAIEAAFADSWKATASGALPRSERPHQRNIAAVGNTAVRVIAGVPNVAGMYRLDQLIADIARHRMWLADAYFVGTTPYVQTLCAAARSGVDVRILLPGSNDIPIVRAFSRAGLRPLLEAGVRIFEWNGSMMHAKTAVADGRWARVGSTNLNVTSWLSNRELDVIVEEPRFAKQMEDAYLADLSNSTEIVLENNRRPVPILAGHIARKRRRSRSAARTATGVVLLSHAVGAAITNQRPLGPAELVILVWSAVLLIGRVINRFVLAARFRFPRGSAGPLAVPMSFDPRLQDSACANSETERSILRTTKSHSLVTLSRHHYLYSVYGTNMMGICPAMSWRWNVAIFRQKRAGAIRNQ